jgi:prephenate dehydratase
VKVGYLGPEGTFSHEAVLASPGIEGFELVGCPTNFDSVMAVHEGTVDRALVPIENSLEGSVNATLDAIAVETDDVRIVGEVVWPIRHCLIAREDMPLDRIQVVVSHPQANAQCARFIRERIPGARVMPADSTADAVRIIAEHNEDWAALGNRVSAEIYGCEILRSGVEDVAGNETRFVWIARDGDSAGDKGPWKTSIVFWGAGDESPGWLARCLLEFASRAVNLTKIESRPRKQGLGHYMFFCDLEGRDTEDSVARAIDAVSGQTETLRVLGSYPSA